MSCLECTDCLDLGSYDVCCEEILIGTAQPSTSYVVRIKDLSLNRIHKQSVTTGVSGEVYLTPDQTKFTPNRTYEVRVYQSGDCSFDNPIDIETDLDENIQSCFSLDFFYAEWLKEQ